MVTMVTTQLLKDSKRRNNMNFMDAYAKTIGKETPPAPKPETPAVTSDDVKAYVDALQYDGVEQRNTWLLDLLTTETETEKTA